ncbi:MAG TPA: trypsin-like serine protease [Thermoanaerobaculia bacterium]
MRNLRLAVLPFGALFLVAACLTAQEQALAARSASDVRAYWTAERLAKAAALPLLRTDTARGAADEAAEGSATTTSAAPVASPGRPPRPGAHVTAVRLYDPRDAADAAATAEPSEPREVAARDVGRELAYFTSSRLVPESAGRTYPYSAVGKLFLTVPGNGDHSCSASVINARIVLTAGHCVHSGNGSASGYYQNWLFVPSYSQGKAPAGTWAASTAFVTDAWYAGRGVVPNASDFAMLEMIDDDSGQRIGDVTGFLGFVTLSLFPNHATMLGYPGNFDSGERMHVVTAGGFKPFQRSTVLYGSDMAGGSSGGPWVENFGLPASGQSVASNLIVGVTSFAPRDTSFKYLGSSTPDKVFTNLFAAICGHQSGNCQ